MGMLVKQFYLGLFLIFLVASPIYVFDSGLPQPGDFLAAFLILLLLTGFIIRLPIHKDWYLISACFLVYVTLVNLFWFGQYEATRFLLTPLYYAFNFGVVLVTISLVKDLRERFVTACYVAFALAIALEIAALLLLPGGTYRQIGTFNNPNQLGYWGLLIGICTLVLTRGRRLNLLDVALLCGTGYVVASSLSKAALAAFALLLLLAFFCQRLTRPAIALLLVAGFFSTAMALTDTSRVDRFLSEGLIGNVLHRFEGVGEQGDDSLAGRGYDRMWRYPEHLVFGAGEGADWRFSRYQSNPRLGQREFHSTLGTVLFSYGIIGFALFLAMLWVIFRRAPLAHVLYSLPIWAYGMTHQGLRTTMMWVFLGLVFGLAHHLQPLRPQQRVVVQRPLGPARASVTGHGLGGSTARSGAR